MHFSISAEDEGTIEGLSGHLSYSLEGQDYPEMERVQVLLCSYNFPLGVLHLCKLGFTLWEGQSC